MIALYKENGIKSTRPSVAMTNYQHTNKDGQNM